MKRVVSERRLLDWLDNDPVRLERYLARFPDEADRLERLTALGGKARQALADAFTVPEGLVERLGIQPPDDYRRETREVAFDLLGLAWHTMRALMSDSETHPPGDEGPEGSP